MNNLNDVVIAKALNRSLYLLADAVLELGKTTYSTASQYERTAAKLQEVYSHNDFLAGIEPKALFQSYLTLKGHEPEMRNRWDELSQSAKQHDKVIDTELAKQPYHYDSDETVNRLIEDGDNAYMDTLNEMSEPLPEYDIVYEMKQNSGGILTLNDRIIAKPRLGSRADDALQSAFTQPNHTIAAQGSLKKFKHDINLPIELKNILFRVSKGSFMVTPYVTQAMLNGHGIVTAEIDDALSKLEPLK